MQELDLMKLYDTSKNFIKVVADPIETLIEYDIKLDDKILTFKVIDSEPIYNEQYIEFYGQQWVVKSTRHDGQFIEITAKHNVEELVGNVFNSVKTNFLNLNDTLLVIFNAANSQFAPFPWTYALSANLLAETAILSKTRALDIAQVTLMSAIEEVASLWFLEVEFDTLNKQVIFHHKRGGSKGVYFSSQLNLRKIDLEVDTYDYATRLIPIGKDDLRITDVNGGIPYVANNTYSSKVITKFWIDTRYTSRTRLRDDAILKLEELARPLRVYSCDIIDLSAINPMFSYEIGDTVTIMNEQLGIKDVQRIMKMKVYPYDTEKNTAELANRRGTFEELQNQMLDAREMVDATILANGKVSGTNVIGINKNFIEIESDVDGISTSIGEINEEINEVVTYARGIILSNESQSFAVGSDGRTSLDFTPIYTKVGTYQAGNRIASTIGTIEFFTSANVPITLPLDASIGFINPTVSEDGEISIILPQGTDLVTRSGYIRVPITISGTMYLKRLYWSTVEVGDDIVGLDGITVILTNESDTIATAFDGTGGNYSNANTYAQVFVGIINDTANWTFSSVEANVVGNFDSIELNKYQVTNMTAPNGYVDITATKGLTSIVKRFTLSQARAGSNGNNGLDGTDGADGLAGLNQATVYLYQRKSGVAPVISDIGTTIYTFATTGLTGTLGAWSRTIPAGSDPIYIIAAAAVASSATASLAPSVWSTPIILSQNGTNGANGADGASAISGYLTNETATVSALANGTGYSLASAGGTFVVFEGTTERTTNAVFSITGGAVKNGLTFAINTSGVYALSGASWTSDTESFTVNAVYGGVTIIKVYTITKAKAGTAGTNGQTLYTWVKYADTPTTGMADSPTGKKYLGLAYNKTSATESTNYADYSWSLIEGPQGPAGTSVSSIIEYYLATTASSGVTTATSGWTTSIQTITTVNKYLWNYELTNFSDGSSATTTPVIIGVYGDTGPTGGTGATGRSITAVTEYYLATNVATGVTRATGGWTTAMQTTTAVNRFLWNYEEVTWSSAPTTTFVEPVIIGVHGETGATGAPAKSISLSPTAQVFKVASGGAVTPANIQIIAELQNTSVTAWTYSVDGGSFSTTLPSGVSRTDNTVTILNTTTATTISVRASDGTVSDVVTIAKVTDGATGSTGAAGADAVTILLSNEAHTFIGDVSNALAGSTFFDIIAFKGSTRIATTIGTITGQVTGLTTSITNNGTNTARVTVNVTTAMVASSGTLVVPITADGKSFTKQFSYTISFRGQTGAQGIQGTAGTNGVDGDDAQYVIVNGAQSFKYLAGQSTPVETSIILTASLFGGLTLYDWEYWNGSSWVDLNVPQNAQTYSLAHNNTAWGVATSLRVRCLSGTQFDEITIVKLYDGTNGVNGTSPIIGYLTNESVSLSALSNGTGYVLTSAGGTFRVFEGITDRTTASIFSITGGTDAGATWNKVQNGLTFTINETTGVYSLSGASWTSDSETFTVNAVYGGVTVTKVYIITKAKAGTAGTNAQYVVVTGPQSFKYLAGQSIPTLTPIVLTASLFGGLTTYDWEYWTGSAWLNLSGTQNAQTYSLAHDNVAWGTATNLRIRCLSGAHFDEVTVVKLYDGTNGSNGTNGTNGTSGLSSAIVFIYQRAEIAPALPSATSTYTFSTATLTGLNNGWTRLVPASNGLPLWVTQATATATAPTNTDTILSSEWAPASILSEDGAQGEIGPSYWLTVDSSFIPVDEFGSYKVAQVTVRGHSSSNYSINDYFGRFIIEALSKTTQTWNTVYMSSSDENQKVYTIGENVASLRFTLYESGGVVNILDSQTVPMVYDGLSNRYVAISSTSQIFQSEDGGINFSPGDIYLTPVMLNATFDKWQFSVNGETFIDLPLSYPAYQIPLAYAVGDTVSHNNINYQCIVAHTSASTSLDVLLVPDSWAEGISYILNSVVEFNGNYYKCITAHTSGASFSEKINNWESIQRKWVAVTDVTQVTRDAYLNVLKVPSNSALFLYGGELTFNVLFRVFVNYTLDGVSYSAFDTVTIARTFNSTELVNVITQTYATRLDSLEKFETEVGERIYYGESYQATNLIANGDFSGGTTSWTALNSTLSATANTLSITGNGANALASARQTNTDAIVGNVYYVAFKARVTNTLCQSIQITHPFANIVKSMPAQNTWYNLSAVGVATLTERLRIAHAYTSLADANAKVMEAKEVLLLNLTQIFGAGKEPDKLEMDDIIAKFSTQWFSGTSPVLRDEPLVQNFTNWKQEIDNFLLGIQSGGGYNLIQNSVGYRDPNNANYGWTLSGAGTVTSVSAAQESFILASTSKNGFGFVGTKVLSQAIPIIPNRQLSFAVKVNTQAISSGTVKIYARINGTDFYLVNRAHDTSNPLNSTFQMNLSSSVATSCTVYVETLNVVGIAYVTDLLLAYGANISEWQQATGEIYNLNVLIDRNGITVNGAEPNSYTNISPFEFAGYYQGNRIFTLNGSVTEVQEIRIKKAVGATETAMWIKPFRIVQTPTSLDFVWVGDTAD